MHNEPTARVPIKASQIKASQIKASQIKASQIKADQVKRAGRADTSESITSIANPQSLDELPPAMTFQTLLLVLLAVVVGALSATTLLPLWVPGLTDSLLGTAPKAYWYLARSSAFVAYLMLWFAMMLGLLITNRWARLWPGGPVAFDLHQHASLLGLAITMFHALILLGDRYIHASLSQLLIPFTYSGYRPLWVGAGQLGFYGLLLVGLSFYIRGTIGRSAWRVIHTLSFLVFFGALLHGIQSGTDSGAPAIQLMYWMTGGSVLFFTMYRVLTLRTSKPNEARASA